MTDPYTCKWGILATGGIAAKFAKDLLADPAKRQVQDVSHQITSVASSSGEERAKKFVQDIGLSPSSVQTYGSYEEFVKDKHTQIIYVATPHSHHYANVKLCLEAGKHVLCEKSFTVNAKQAEELFALARSKNLFLMEAVWTRFFPLTIELRRLLHEERVIGKLRRAHADFSTAFSREDLTNRMWNPDLAGGALLDLGIYSLTWILMVLYEDPDNHSTPPKVSGSSLMSKLNPVDEFTTIALNFETLEAQGIATTCLSASSFPGNALVVQGDKGYLKVEKNLHRPEEFFISTPNPDGTPGAEKKTKFEIPGEGMFWEADACARALRDGKTEAPGCPLSTTSLTMRIMTEVRESNNFRYGTGIEDLDL